MSLAIGSLAVMEGPAPDRALVMATLSDRIGACPRFSQRLRRRRFDLGAPEWVDDPRFDLAHHVRRIAQPRPGDDEALFQVAADAMATRLDRDRPLLQIWLIEGPTDDRWAMLTKFHYCMADEIAATHILAGLCDHNAVESFARHVNSARESKPDGPQQRSLSINPLTIASGLWSTSATLATTAAWVAQWVADLAIGSGRPSSPLTDR